MVYEWARQGLQASAELLNGKIDNSKNVWRGVL